ncbi:glycosyltransferase [Erythrobacter sp.]|uniref:glycosyltransferase n=1 Tax=Erythrobacter sp. TaxID=1042 RepID=UPI0025BFB8C9|nr:glycosyltransferase [Erythrobacter sp.]
MQVATSIVDELSQSGLASNIYLALSSVVLESCLKIGADLTVFRHVEIVDIRGFEPLNLKLDNLIKEADIVFTVFGPLYSVRKARKSIVGFAQPWIIYPKNEAYFKLPFGQRTKLRVKYFVQWLAFVRNSNLLLVEADHVRERLKVLAPEKHVLVVPNALNAVFREAIEKSPYTVPRIAQLNPRVSKTERIKLGYVGRAYSHKNIEILPKVRAALREKYGLIVEIEVTLDDNEWAAQTEDFRREIRNVGSMSLRELVDFYGSLDGVLFPSLLECFSATPLEAMAMGLPLFASNRDFVRDFCEDYPFYFDPLDPESIADAVASSLDLPYDVLQARLEASRAHVLSLPTATDRAKRLMELLRSL